ncbi:winged helix-turn-helix domain-containing protein [Nocardiopsis composta]|uniref:Transposase n=1 Tax=Nocardiopsis composta TaxID=157465 RepID=A0A7W8QV54_9ACTN|nr:winged helix-turn-helix domain-containing protein [Nocardiopsis composta]MBB5436251.1 transposase [Nocardiopsis composta]
MNDPTAPSGPADLAGLSPDERDRRLKQAYEAGGTSIQALARASGLPYTTVWESLQRTGATRPQDGVTDAELRRLKQDEGLTLQQIARRVGLSRGTVHRRLSRAGVPMRRGPRPREKTVDTSGLPRPPRPSVHSAAVSLAMAVVCGAGDFELAVRFGGRPGALDHRLARHGLPRVSALRRQALAAGSALGTSVEELALRFGMEAAEVRELLDEAREQRSAVLSPLETPDATEGRACAALCRLGAGLAPALNALDPPPMSGGWVGEVDAVPRGVERVAVAAGEARRALRDVVYALENLEPALKEVDAVPVEPPDRCLTTADPDAARGLHRRRRAAAAQHGLSPEVMVALRTGRLIARSRRNLHLVADAALDTRLGGDEARSARVLAEAVRAYLAPRPDRHLRALRLLAAGGRAPLQESDAECRGDGPPGKAPAAG